MQTDNVSDLSLRLNAWVLTNRQELRKWWVICILGVNVFLLSAVLTQGLLFLFKFQDSGSITQIIVASVASVGEQSAVVAPKPLVTAAPVSVLHGAGRFDFLQRLENPNANWQAVAEVTFQGGAKTLPPVRVVLSPKSTLYAVALDIEPKSTTGVPQPTATLTRVSWTRQVIDPFADIRVKIENVQQAQVELTTGDQAKRMVTQVTGTVVNPSLYAIRGLRIGILLLRDQSVVGVRTAIVSVPREARAPFSVEWEDVVSGVTSIQTYPELHAEIIVAS
ncbi:MAG: hypothetical protein WCV85_02135 [Patescibacteria group bacterium]|jgi:hypothetical protein